MKAFRYLAMIVALAVPSYAIADHFLSADDDCCYPGSPCCKNHCPHCPRG